MTGTCYLPFIPVLCLSPGYNAKEYEKRRGERIEKPRIESKRYYTPPSIESDFDHCMQVRKTHQSIVRHAKKNEIKMAMVSTRLNITNRHQELNPRFARVRPVCVSHRASF